MLSLHHIHNLFPYTTLFRSHLNYRPRLAARLAWRDLVAAPDCDLTLTRVGEQFQGGTQVAPRSEEHTSELQSPMYLVCRLLLEKKKIYSFTKAPNICQN